MLGTIRKDIASYIREQNLPLANDWREDRLGAVVEFRCSTGCWTGAGIHPVALGTDPGAVRVSE
jgi:hypothetical protein